MTCLLHRCCSLESPKKLRFAVHHDDGTPVRRRPSGVAEEDEYSCCDRHLSVSCPCIDHFDDAQTGGRPRPLTTTSGGGGGGAERSSVALLLQPPAETSSSASSSGFPRVNSAPVTPMVADCVDMTDLSCAPEDDVNEPLLIRPSADRGDAAAGGAAAMITFG